MNVGTMSRDDRRAWGAAAGIADLGELTARWLEGELVSRPGYGPGCGPDAETGPIVGVLVAANRAGYVTHDSDPGGPWARASVSGFAGDAMLAALRAAADERGLWVCAGRAGRRTRYVLPDGTALTGWRAYRTRRPDLGPCLSRKHIRDGWTGYGICGDAALDALCGAWQVTVIDPETGARGAVWDALAAATSAAREEL